MCYTPTVRGPSATTKRRTGCAIKPFVPVRRASAVRRRACDLPAGLLRLDGRAAALGATTGRCSSDAPARGGARLGPLGGHPLALGRAATGHRLVRRGAALGTAAGRGARHPALVAGRALLLRRRPTRHREAERRAQEERLVHRRRAPPTGDAGV